jgi:hypothetical protein
MRIVRVYIVRLIVDTASSSEDSELRGSVVEVSSQKTQLFENSANLLEILCDGGQKGNSELDRKPDLRGEAK